MKQLNKIADYIMSDDFNNKVNIVVSWIFPLFGAIMVARIVKFLLEFIYNH